MTARPDVPGPRTSDRRLVRPPQVSGVTPEQLRAWRAAADACGMKLAAWIRQACDAAMERTGTISPQSRQKHT